MGVFQKVLCIGDSQTFGARSAAGYPEYMADILCEKSGGKVSWMCVNEAINGETVLQILRRTDRAVRFFDDVFMVCVLAGTNDYRADVMTKTDLFRNLYRQLLLRILCSTSKATVRGKFVFPATLSMPQTGFANLPYSAESLPRAKVLNGIIEEIANELKLGDYLVRLDDMGVEYFADAVHYNDAGCIEVAKRFADKIIARSV